MANIVRLILFDFLRLITLAMIIAWLLFYLINRILVANIFAYSAEFGFGFYVLTGALTLLTGLAAVLSQTINAARAIPVDSLRYE